MGAASLGCPLAAELFGLNILEEDVQDQSCNTTRFAVIGRQETQPSGRDRTTKPRSRAGHICSPDS